MLKIRQFVKSIYLGSEGRGGSNLSSYHAELDDLNLIGIKLGTHLDCLKVMRGVLEVLRQIDRQAGL